MKSKLLKILAVVITIVIIVILFSQIQVEDIITTLAGIDPSYLIAGFFLYICSHFFRALRFHILLNRDVKLKDLFTIVCVHNMMNNIMPARIGELSYIYLVKKLHNKTTGEGIATLSVARVFDFITISLLFFISVLIIQDLPEMIIKVVWAIAFFMIIIVIFLIILLYFGESVLNLVRRFFGRFNLDKKYFADYLLRKGEETAESFNKIKSKNVAFRISLLSALLWGLNYLMIFILLNGMGVFLSFPKVVLGATFILLITVLPIQGIGGFGTTEGVWTAVFVLLGLTLETAIVSGFSYHIIIWIYFLILGCYGMINIKLSN